MDDQVTIRPAAPDDVEALHGFVVGLAADEGHPDAVEAVPGDLEDVLFGPDAAARALVAVVAGEPVGFAIWFTTYSTVRGRRGIHLEDLYVAPGHRGAGIGARLLRALAALAAERGWARLEWWVLHTNTGARRLYDRLGARALDELAVMRVDGAGLDLLATRRGSEPAP